MRIVRDTDDSFSWELAKLRSLKKVQAEVEAQLTEQTELVTQLLADRGLRSTTSDGFKFTLVQAERTKINEVGLKKAVGARVYNKLCIQKIDQNKVKEALATGALDPVVLSQYSENVLNKPSIRVTELPLDADE